MDLIDIIIFAGIVYFICRLGNGILQALDLVHMSERVELLKKLDDIVHQVKIEKTGDIEYWYDFHDDEFLGQGRTMEEVIQVLKARFPDHLFLLKDQGGISAKTNWQLMSPEEFRHVLEIK
jgi:hypothetical protein